MKEKCKKSCQIGKRKEKKRRKKGVIVRKGNALKGKGRMKESVILIIEDDEDIRTGIRILLTNENYQILEADGGQQGLKQLGRNVDLVILDVMMPGMSGLKVCEEIRKISTVPILFLTAKAQESDKLIGLMAGADDYLTKPFSYAELLGRVKALLRRYQIYKGKEEIGQETEHWLKCGDLCLNTDFNELLIGRKEQLLSEIEYQILRLLMLHPRRIFSAQNLYEMVWNEPYFYTCSSTVMVHIGNLRKKIEKDPKNPVYIVTIYGKGYRFEGE